MMDQKRGTEKESRSGSEPKVLPDAAKSLAEQDPLLLLAMCIFGEARGEDPQTRQAVAQTVINRAKYPHPVFGSRRGLAFAENLRRVVLQPKQFSSFNPDDPNYSKLLHPLAHEEPAVWEQCLRCAQEALAAREQDDTLTANSDHYFDDSIQPPVWADPAKQTVKIGRLNFYRLYLPSLQSSTATSLVHSQRRAGSVAVKAPLEPSPAALSCPHTSPPAPAHATVRTIGLSQHRWEIRGGWLASLALLALSLALAGCTDFERTAYRTLAITQVEYETLQEQAVEAALDGLLTEEQWDRFATAGHRFIHAHNAAVEAFALWSQSKSKKDAARLGAMLEMLPGLIREIHELVQSFEQESEGMKKPEVRSQKKLIPFGKLRAGSRRHTPRDDSFGFGLGFSICLLASDF